MFQSVLRPEALPRRDFVGGAGIALPLLAALFAASLWASARHQVPREPPEVTVLPLRLAPAPPVTQPRQAPERAPTPARRAASLPSPVVAPTVIPEERPAQGDATGMERAPDSGPDPGARPPGMGPGPDTGVRTPEAPTGPLEFDRLTMKDPVFLSGPSPRYTARAIEREVEGTAEARCVVTAEGRIHDCRILKSLPFMDRAVIEALEQRRYLPATQGGRPVEVDYTFRLTLRLQD